MSTEGPTIYACDVHADDTDVDSNIEPEAPPTQGAPTAASRLAGEQPDAANIPPNDRQPGNDAGEQISDNNSTIVNSQVHVSLQCTRKSTVSASRDLRPQPQHRQYFGSTLAYSYPQ